jgi:hypothetical protein
MKKSAELDFSVITGAGGWFKRRERQSSPQIDGTVFQHFQERSLHQELPDKLPSSDRDENT